MALRSLTKVVGVAGLVTFLASPRSTGASDEAGPDRKDLEMAEDLEVLAEVVARALERFQPEAAAVALLGKQGSTRWKDAESAWRKALSPAAGGRRGGGRPRAVHLPGYGVVVQADAPALAEEPAQGGGGNAPQKAPDDWDLARRILRGAPPPAAGEGRARTEPTRADLTDAVIRLMARNGHRLRHLAAGERLTIALEIEGQARDYGTAWPVGPDSFRPESTSAADGGAWEAETPTATDGARDYFRAPDPALESRVLSGDLHLRQGNYEKAIEAFQQAADAYRQDSTVRTRLLHALAGAGKYAEARALLDRLAAGTGAGGAADRQEQARFAVPGRLVLSATKESLDEAGTGSMPLEEFRKQVQVTYFPPSVLPKGSGENGSARLEGIISAVDAKDGVAILSLGKEQGARVGLRLRAVRRDGDGASTGLLEVVKVHADLSEARVLEGSPQRGDRVRAEAP
jgi:hypothetical protein